jgi:hypothetical protein
MSTHTNMHTSEHVHRHTYTYAINMMAALLRDISHCEISVHKVLNALNDISYIGSIERKVTWDEIRNVTIYVC